MTAHLNRSTPRSLGNAGDGEYEADRFVGDDVDIEETPLSCQSSFMTAK